MSLDAEVYLGRPWRGLSRVIYQNSDLSGIIHPEGWTTMAEGATPSVPLFLVPFLGKRIKAHKKRNHSLTLILSSIYEEFENTGDGSDTSERLYLTEATEAVTKEVLFGDYSWIDTSY